MPTTVKPNPVWKSYLCKGCYNYLYTVEDGDDSAEAAQAFDQSVSLTAGKITSNIYWVVSLTEHAEDHLRWDGGEILGQKPGLVQSEFTFQMAWTLCAQQRDHQAPAASQ